MAKEPSSILKVCDFITKYSIYALVFLVPILFLPWTSDVLDFNKQSLLILLVFVALFAWMLRVLVSGKLEIKMSLMNTVVGIFFLVYLLSTIFSVFKYGSFWGWPQITSESLLSVIALVLFYFLVSNIFSKRNIFVSTIILSFSVLLAELIGVFQLFGLFIVPFDFAKTVAFNTIGLAGSLGFFAAITLPLAMVLLMVTKKWWKILFVLEVTLSALILVLVNYTMIWWAVIIGSALIIIFGVLKRSFFDGRWLALPMFFLAVSLFFALLSPQINFLPQKANEVFLAQGATFQIMESTLGQAPIFGSGPGTFAYDFSKFKNPDFDKTSLWNVTFNRGSSKILNDMTTTGIFGILAFLALILFPIFYGIKFLFAGKVADGAEKEDAGVYQILTLGLSTALIVQGFAYFLYNSNVVLDFIFFFLIAALIGLIAEKKKYVLKPSSSTTLIATFVFTMILIFGLGLLILDGQRYIAEVSYYNGLTKWQQGQQDQGTKNIESAASINSSSDLYFRQLSQVYLLELQNEIQNTKTAPSAAESQKIQTLVANSVNAAKIATDLNPQSVDDWSIRGYVYQNLFGLVNSSDTWAMTSYDQALKLSPNNPYLLFQEGNVLLASALRLTPDQAQQKNQLLSQAQAQLEKAVSLTPNYSNALYSLGLTYNGLGQNDKAIQAFKAVQQLNPQNTDIQSILNNLSAGLPALQSATPPITPPAGEIPNPTSTSIKTTPKTK